MRAPLKKSVSFDEVVHIKFMPMQQRHPRTRKSRNKEPCLLLNNRQRAERKHYYNENKNNNGRGDSHSSDTSDSQSCDGILLSAKRKSRVNFGNEMTGILKNHHQPILPPSAIRRGAQKRVVAESVGAGVEDQMPSLPLRSDSFGSIRTATEKSEPKDFTPSLPSRKGSFSNNVATVVVKRNIRIMEKKDDSDLVSRVSPNALSLRDVCCRASSRPEKKETNASNCRDKDDNKMNLRKKFISEYDARSERITALEKQSCIKDALDTALELITLDNDDATSTNTTTNMETLKPSFSY